MTRSIPVTKCYIDFFIFNIFLQRSPFKTQLFAYSTTLLITLNKFIICNKQQKYLFSSSSRSLSGKKLVSTVGSLVTFFFFNNVDEEGESNSSSSASSSGSNDKVDLYIIFFNSKITCTSYELIQAIFLRHSRASGAKYLLAVFACFLFFILFLFHLKF
ncbi:hypothetical protein T07_1114 [Trichinella nelsoni]|uniref:Transmembrane protein n=1 Tax=Trichinella nelsoni TaxID=6336 RepID=A0A0V0SPP4_9BILA|nr:hypothetical protein T07_1114 [Trichinella nelsoni]